MKRRKKIYMLIAVISIIACTAASIIIYLGTPFNDPINEYDSMTMKEIAWQYLSDDEKGTVVITTEGLYINEQDDEGSEVVTLNETLMNVSDIWRYAKIEEVAYREIDYLLDNEDNTIWEKINKYKKRNNKIVMVLFETSNFVLGPIRIYVDTKEEEVIGVGWRM